METLKNGVPSNIYYAILEWKDSNLKEWQEIKGELRVCDLSPIDLWQFYKGVVKK